MKKKYKLLITGIIYITLITLLTFLFIKYLGNILKLLNVKSLDEIFMQLNDATIVLPFYIPVVSIDLILLILYKTRLHKIIKIVLVILIILITLILMIVLSKVNDVLFIRVIISLIKTLGSGEVSL